MRHSIETELTQMGSSGRLSDSGLRSADTATLDLLSAWQQEDATTDPSQVKAAEEELAVFMKAVNDARTSSGEPLIYP